MRGSALSYFPTLCASVAGRSRDYGRTRTFQTDYGIHPRMAIFAPIGAAACSRWLQPPGSVQIHHPAPEGRQRGLRSPSCRPSGANGISDRTNPRAEATRLHASAPPGPQNSFQPAPSLRHATDPDRSDYSVGSIGAESVADTSAILASSLPRIADREPAQGGQVFTTTAFRKRLPADLRNSTDGKRPSTGQSISAVGRALLPVKTGQGSSDRPTNATVNFGRSLRQFTAAQEKIT